MFEPSDSQEAKEYLHSVFLSKYKRKFARKPKVEEIAYKSIPKGIDLDRILCISFGEKRVRSFK